MAGMGMEPIFGRKEDDPYWDLDSWDEDELIRGQRKNAKGTFANKPVKYIPTSVHQELVKRQMRLASHLLNAKLFMAAKMLVDIITSPSTEDPTRLRAIGMLFDRTMGKAPEKVEVTSDAPWVLALRDVAVVGTDRQADVIDIDPIEEDDPWMD